MITDFSHLYKSVVVVFRLIVESAGQNVFLVHCQTGEQQKK